MPWKPITPAFFRPVSNSEDFKRVDALPEKEDLSHLYGDLRAELTKPAAEHSLWDRQCQALLEAKSVKGLFAPIPVGGGKTLVCLLLPTVLDKKAIILTTPSLIKQMEAEREKYSKSFYIRTDIRIIAYSTLSKTDAVHLLEELGPELIIADECHCLKAAKSARTQRWIKFMRKHPETLFAGLSGTITKRSLRDFAHLCKAALRMNAPVPYKWPVLQEWSEALDVSDFRRPGGVLKKWCQGEEDVRLGFQRKMRSCMGVSGGQNIQLNVPLTVLFVENYTLTSKILDKTTILANKWEDPDGKQLNLALDIARFKRQLRLGGYYRLRWDPDVLQIDRDIWTDVKRAFEKEVVSYLSRYDSVANVVRNEGHRLEMLPKWEEVKSRIPAPENEWVWIDENPVVDICQRWLKNHVGIIWTDVIEVGKHLADRLGLHYYGQGADDLSETDGKTSIVCSIQAHGVGKNLQHFNRSLVVGGGPTGLVWEQLTGRMHRPGQTKDVKFYVLFEEEVERAKEDAEYIHQLTGNPQKLLDATYQDCTLTSEGEILEKRGN